VERTLRLLTAGLLLIRTPLLAVDFGTHYPLVVVGIGCMDGFFIISSIHSLLREL